MLEGNSNDIVLSEVCSDGSEPLSYLICFIGLQVRTRVSKSTRRRRDARTF